MTPAPERYAVIGHPVAHSLSPWIHAQFAQQSGRRLIYSAIDVPSEELARRVREFFAQGGSGLNVTVPHKQAVLQLIHTLSERARVAGAVNTIVRETAQHLRGENTDGVGLVRDLTVNLGLAVAGQRVLLLGAGGAARGVLGPLLALAPAELHIVNRSPERSRELAHTFASQGPVHGDGFEQLDGLDYGLILNATAASLNNQLPALPAATLSPTTVCYDLAYGQAPTRFVQWARERGARRAYMGEGMLVEQAAESFLLWHGTRPDTAPVLAQLRRSEP
jgi:shikimate dehydrogenase